jgi:hypothetical protein
MGLLQRRKSTRGITPSGREIVNVEGWKKFAHEAYRLYRGQEDLSVAGVAAMMNKRYATRRRNPGLTELGIRRLFADFNLPLKSWDLARIRDQGMAPLPPTGGSGRSGGGGGSSNPVLDQIRRNERVQQLGDPYTGGPDGRVPWSPQ